MPLPFGISRADRSEDDPVVEKFLDFLEQDLEDKPQHIQAVSSDLVNRIDSLVAEVEIELDAPLSDE